MTAATAIRIRSIFRSRAPSCRIKLTFSDSKQIVAIEPGAAFDATQWEQVVEEVERTGPHKVGRDCSG